MAEFSAAQAVAAGTDFAELRVSDAGLLWNELRPADGACRLWLWRDEQAHCLTPDGFSVRSRVYEYGGGSFCVGAGEVLFVNEADQQIYRQALQGGAPQRVSQDASSRYGDLHWHAGLLLAVEEHHAEQVVHRLVAFADSQRQVLAEGADFYAAPTLSGDAQRLAWIEWSRPAQPWSHTRLMSAQRGADGRWHTPRCVAGAELPQALQQPRFDAAGRLLCLSDLNGFWQPWGECAERWQALPALAADHAAAPWQLGACTWLPLADEGFLATWFEDGFGHLGVQRAGHTEQHLASAYSRFRSLALDAQYLYAIAASPTQLPCVLRIRRADGALTVLAGGGSPLAAQQISQPQPLTYPSGGATAHGFFYPPSQAQGAAPLLVFVHGGPTSACYPVLDPRIQFWTQRGFAVADLNYRGSTGYGRAYRQALHLRWGDSDVEDACAAVAHLAARGVIDPTRAFIRGGSSGGYTTLCALAFSKVFRGGASWYGVSDPLALGRVTHKFEGDYLDWLIGDPHADAERYRQRTPLLHASDIEVPVIFFQGELDAVVVPQQTRSMLDALRANGVDAEGHFYPGERHGLRRAANLAHALEAEWRFYCQILAERP
ncbi:alpha/beta hydrolase family protein [Pseudomonas cremoricolorata]|uniref:alpha/beta hydrolase family protein n=1 Tax=Pseudomonas cremoricolorata TaxID=157783 RepID=UPI0003F5026C|nr:prolyl oligopeptidase family serine peptidase [Pseudomonas cremoricolorata]